MSDAIRWISLDTESSPAPAPPGVVYASSPRVAVARDGVRYFFKGPAIEVVVAEAVGYMLAGEVGLPVPEWALCQAPGGGGVLFASRAAKISSGVLALLRAGKTTNPGMLPHCLAMDVWTANTDRNAGSLVADPAHDPGRPGAVELLAIDFERAQVLRGTDFLTVGSLDDRELWPRGEIADLCRGLAHPAEACARIARVRRTRLDGMFDRLAVALVREIPWAASAARQLEQRGERIESLVRRVWRA